MRVFGLKHPAGDSAMTQPLSGAKYDFLSGCHAFTHFLLVSVSFFKSWSRQSLVANTQRSFRRAWSHVYTFSINLVSDQSLCVAAAATNNRNYFNYQQLSPERRGDDSFIIMSLHCLLQACCSFSQAVLDFSLKTRWTFRLTGTACSFLFANLWSQGQ